MGSKIVTNLITTALNALATIKGYVVRYDNDPRINPTSGSWLVASVRIGSRDQIEAPPLYRTIGILMIQVKTEHSLGSASALTIADILAAEFTGTTFGVVKFKTARIENVGRVGDNYQVNVICPFHADEN